MAGPNPFAAPLFDAASDSAPWRWGAAVWVVTWPLRDLWTNLLVLVWALVEVDARVLPFVWAVEAVCGLGLIGGAWVVCGSLVPRYVPALLFGATLRLGLLATGRFTAQLPLLDGWIDLAAAVALHAALRRLGRRRIARGAWLLTLVVVLDLVVEMFAPMVAPERSWELASLSLGLATWFGMTGLLLAVVVEPRPTN
ncbi:MAG: hypothetical protein ACI8PZ_000767 [Myxococcota bacterium]|jgi:hypothetical protein